MIITEKLLQRFHEGLCTPEEEEAMKRWLSEDEDLPSEISLIDSREFRDSKDSILNKIELLGADLSESESDQGVPLSPKQVDFRKPRRALAIRYATAAIILCTVGFFTYQFSDYAFGNGTEQSIASRTIKTQRGEKRTITLSDGSTICMNYETEIKALETFERDQRIVYLTGHAHFDVARDTERPFIIYTKDSKTQVLGTSFEINTKEEGATEIIVTSGKVAFSEKDKVNNLVTLTLNDRAVLGADRIIKTDEVDAQRLTAWRENKLLFDGETLAEIIEVLEPWYDIEITVESEELLKEDFILSLDNPPLSSVLEDLSFASGLEYKIQGKQVIIF